MNLLLSKPSVYKSFTTRNEWLFACHIHHIRQYYSHWTTAMIVANNHAWHHHCPPMKEDTFNMLYIARNHV